MICLKGKKLSKIIFNICIFLILINFAYAEQECEIDKYIKIEGNGICLRNCSENVFYSKELFDINITQIKPNVRIWFRVVDPFSTKEPFSISRKSEFDPLYIKNPTVNNFGYYYWINALDESYFNSIRIRVLSYEYYNLCEQKSKPSINDTNGTTNISSKIPEINYSANVTDNSNRTKPINVIPPIITPPNFTETLINISFKYRYIIFIIIVILVAKYKGKPPRKSLWEFIKHTTGISIPNNKKSKKSKP